MQLTDNNEMVLDSLQQTGDSWAELPLGFASAAHEVLTTLGDPDVDMSSLELLPVDLLNSMVSGVSPQTTTNDFVNDDDGGGGGGGEEFSGAGGAVFTPNTSGIPMLQPGKSLLISLDSADVTPVDADKQLTAVAAQVDQSKMPERLFFNQEELLGGAKPKDKMALELTPEEIKRRKNKVTAKRNRDKARLYKSELENESKRLDDELLLAKSQLAEVRHKEEEERQRAIYLQTILGHDRILHDLISKLPDLQPQQGEWSCFLFHDGGYSALSILSVL